MTGTETRLATAPDWLLDLIHAPSHGTVAAADHEPLDLAVLLAWTFAGARVAVRRFRWEPAAQSGSARRHRQPHVSAARR